MKQAGVSTDAVRKRSPKRIAVQRVLDAAMQWHKWLVLANPTEGYPAYLSAAKRLKKACARLKKVSR